MGARLILGKPVGFIGIAQESSPASEDFIPTARSIAFVQKVVVSKRENANFPRRRPRRRLHDVLKILVEAAVYCLAMLGEATLHALMIIAASAILTSVPMPTARVVAQGAIGTHAGGAFSALVW